MSCCVVGKQAAVQMFISVGLPLVHKLDEHGLDRLIEALVKAIGLQKMTHTYCSFDSISVSRVYTENGPPKVCLTFGLLRDCILCTKR